MDKQHRFNILYLVAAVVAIFLIQDILQQANTVEEIPYSRFVKLTEDGKVTKADRAHVIELEKATTEAIKVSAQVNHAVQAAYEKAKY